MLVAERLPEQVRLVRAEFLVMELLTPVLSQISELIEDRCATTLRRLVMSTSQGEAETDTPDEEGPGP